MTTTTQIAPSSRSWWMAKVTSPIALALAGRPFVPLWAVVHHRGRKSGRDLSVPVAVMTTNDVFVITLPFGPGTNWARNVLAAGGCTLRWKGADHLVTRPELIGADEAKRYFSKLQWSIQERMFGASAFLRLQRTAG
ncbi:hypothetical protein [Pseudonocardia sp. TRM90224]|uniref:hypothetical protein n=1 Tax=Pseudonocardia sp. TRM90224 TaxID=2812678 RepID=UPI001E57ECE8|nr:hypothetical protein [Pseudonocardia sp. TRM90224]